MNKAARGGVLFRSDDDRADFMSLLADVHWRYRIEIHAVCIMGTHYHLLVRTPLGNLSPAMRHIDGVFAQRFNRRHGLDGSIYKDRFRSKLVDTDGYLDRVVRYIHRNPLEAGMVEHLADYPWSSYPLFLGPPELRPRWLYDAALSWSGVRTADDLRSFTEGPGKSTDLDLAKYPLAIGSESFIASSIASLQSSASTIGQLREAAVRPSVSSIEEAIAVEFGCTAASLRVKGASSKARFVAVGLSQEIGGLTLAEIAERYGYSTSTSAGAAASRFRALSKNDAAWAIRIGELRATIEGMPVDDRCRVSNRSATG